VGKREIRVYMLSAPAIPAILAVFLDGLIFSKKKKLLTGLTGIIILLAAVFTGVLYSATAIATRYTHKPVIEYLARHPEIDKVLMNTNTMGQGGTSDKMCNWTLGFYVCDFWVYSPDNNGVFVHKNGGRAAVYYRNIHEAEKKPPYIIGHPWICWPENVLAWYKEGKIKYYLSSPLDMQIFHDNDPKVQPIFSYPSPLIYRARLYEMFSSLDAIKTCHESPFYRQIGIYDISVMLEVI
jgi:hypothetical protein